MLLLHELPLTFITEVLNLAAGVCTSIEIMPLVNKWLIAKYTPSPLCLRQAIIMDFVTKVISTDIKYNNNKGHKNELGNHRYT